MILFEYANVEPLNLTLEHKQWLKSIIRHESLVPGNISYLFCNDQCLLQRNLFFLHHDTLTDIITFDFNILMKLLYPAMYNNTSV